MASSFSSKKVARAARTGGGRRRKGGGSDYGWYAVMLVCALLGTILVAYSRHERLAENAPLNPTLEFVAYGVYLCDAFAPNINNDNEPRGVGTRNDGIIHVAKGRTLASDNADFNDFASVVDLEVSEDSVTMPGGETYGPDRKCGDQDASLQVKEWSNATDPASGRIVEGDPGDIRLKDNSAIVVAFVPEGTDIPLPPSAANLAQVAAAQRGEATGAQQVPVQPADGTSTDISIAPADSPAIPDDAATTVPNADVPATTAP